MHKSENVMQSQQNFAWKHVLLSVTFRNSDDIVNKVKTRKRNNIYVCEIKNEEK